MTRREKQLADLMERATLFQLAAMIFNQPAPGRRAEVLEVFQALRRTLPAEDERFADALHRAELAWAAVDDEQLAHDYQRLYSRTAAVDLHESAYLPPRLVNRAIQVADLEGMYQVLHYDWHGDGVEYADHLCAELGFIGHLLRQEVFAITRGLSTQAEAVHETSTAFLRHHLARWTASLCRELTRHGAGTPYPASAALLDALVGRECKSRKLPTSTLRRRPRKPQKAEH